MKLSQRLFSFGLLLVVCVASGCPRFQSERVIRLGERHEGVLRASDPIRSEPPRGPERRWLFDAQAGQKITIAAESYECNVYLLLLDPQGKQVAWADDNGWFFNARIRATLPAAGRYTIIVCSANADQAGAYWLSLEEGDHEVEWNEPAVEAYYRRGLEWAEQEKNQRAISWMHLAMGKYFRERRQWKQAGEHYAKSLAAAEQINFLYGRWAVTLERGTMWTERMRFDQAVGELERALELSKKLRAQDPAGAAVSTQLGDLYYNTERNDLASMYYQKALAQAERAGDPTTRARVYVSMYGSLALKQPKQASQYVREAYELREGLDPLTELQCVERLAGLYLTPDRITKFLELIEPAQQIAHRWGFIREETSALILMSLEYTLSEKFEDAIRVAREAAELASQLEDPEPWRIALQIKAEAEERLRDYEASLRSCYAALSTVERAWAKEPVEELQQEYLVQAKTICTQIIGNLNALNEPHFSHEYARQAFAVAERSRSRSLLNQLGATPKNSGTSMDGSLLDRDQRLLEKISMLGRQLVLLRAGDRVDRASFDRLEEMRAQLVSERLQLQAEVRHATANSYRAVQLAPLTAEQVQREFLTAHPKAAILFYQLGIQESFLIVLTRDNAHLFKLPNWKNIGDAVAEWQAQIRRQFDPAERTPSAVRDYARIASRLYDILIKPAASLIRGRELIIVPDFALRNLAFEALVVDKPSGQAIRPHYVVEHHAITYAPSISVLAAIEHGRAQTRSGNRIFLVGDAVFNDRDPRIAQTNHPDPNQSSLLAMAYNQRLRSGLDRLPATQEEVVEIAKLAERYQWSPTMRLGFEVDEENFKSGNLSSYRILHLATHAVADYEDGGFSAVVLSLSGKKAGEDGILTAAEIARLKLNADLVVLSGCGTGAGKTTSAEGVVGLSRAFIVAGAQRVCSSLWKVEDISTQKLMNAFYEELIAKGLNMPRALQQAKIELLRSGAAPYYWAPFILIGSLR